MSGHFNELLAAEAFVQVVNTGSFAAAARLRNENPSSVSRAISQLEHHLGVRLLIRTTRTVRISEAGETYLRYARHMLDHQQQARDALAQLNTGRPRGLVRVSMPVVVGEYLLADRLKEFHAEFPEVELQVDLSNKTVQLVEEGIDLAFRFGPLADSSLRAKRISTIWRHVYASPAYLEQHGEPKHPSELANHQCIAFSQRGEVKEWEIWPPEGGESQKYRVNNWLTCSSPMMVVKAIIAGVGLGRSAYWMTSAALARGDLVQVLKDWRCDDPVRGGVPIHLVYPPGPSGQVSLKVRVVAQFMERVLKEAFDAPGPEF